MTPRAKKNPASSRDRKKSVRPTKVPHHDTGARETASILETTEPGKEYTTETPLVAVQDAPAELTHMPVINEYVTENINKPAIMHKTDKEPQVAGEVASEIATGSVLESALPESDPSPEPCMANDAPAPEADIQTEAKTLLEANPMTTFEADSTPEQESVPNAVSTASVESSCAATPGINTPILEADGSKTTEGASEKAPNSPEDPANDIPVVSIIMNCRNSAAYLREAINCVFEQTFSSWEIIFWDNASTDGSPKIAQSFTDKRMRYFRAEEPTPLGEARNLAIAKARGRYIAFLDCDDLWAPSKLEKQVALLEKNPNAGLVCTDTMIFSGRSFTPGSRGTIRRMFSVAAPHRGMVFRQLITAGWIAMSAAIIRRTALDNLEEWFDPSFNVAEEADLFYRIAHDWELDYVHEVLTGWRVHNANNTFSRIGEFGDETRRILQKHERLYPHYAEEYPDIVALLSRRAAFQSAVGMWRDGNGAMARREIAGYPQTPKFQAFWFISWLPGSLFNMAAKAYQFLPAIFRR